MESKSRVMFDLNELPEDDLESSPTREAEVETGKAFGSAPCDSVPNPVPELESAKTLANVGSFESLMSPPQTSQVIDPTPIHLGHHPLSCFRPFVRTVEKTPSGVERLYTVKESQQFDDAKGARTVRVESAVSKQPDVLNNGHTADSDDSNGNQGKQCLSRDAENPCSSETVAPSSNGDDGFFRLTEHPADVGSVKEVIEDSPLEPVIVDTVSKADLTNSSQFTTDNRTSSCVGKRDRSDPRDAKLGKKRARQTMFLDVREAAKQAPPPKTPTVKKNVASIGFRNPSRTVPDQRHKDAKIPSPLRDGLRGTMITNSMEPKPSGMSSHEGTHAIASDGSTTTQIGFRSTVPVGDHTYEGQSKNRLGENETKLRGLPHTKQAAGGKYTSGGFSHEEKPPCHMRPTAKKNPNALRRPISSSNDTSIARLHREATCEKLWKSSVAGEADLQCVPVSFDSVQDYVNVFEPLLLEECRAQLHSTWEELCEGVALKDPHVQVYVKMVEKRERGWYELVLFAVDAQSRLVFKEGDVAVLSTPKPGQGGRMRRTSSISVIESSEEDASSRTAGIIRRHVPIDTRELHGATLRFYVGESFITEETVKKKFQSKGTMWYLTVLGSLATTQREYVALHAFQNLQPQMIRAILNPKPEHFPRYDEEAPAMPDCFTQPFVQHLHRNFNEPQLTAIKWAAMHTAAGSISSNGSRKRQEPWPFTLVQGPPGTGKTHTVWGMLNVIHLVQYQRYYAALLKKLAPGSLKADEPSIENPSPHGGGLDDVLQKMDQNLARSLPKLCPKPRMLVCAPSNAATDELLTRVLERGFIDGEMKVYRPDVARVGVDTQTRASQAVSVERRSDHLLGMSRDDVLGWLQQLRGREAFLAQQITALQKELAITAAASSQGSVGVDPDILSARDQSRDSKLQQLAAIVEERDKVLVEMSRLFIVEGRFRGGFGSSPEEARAKLEASFANEAEIVFTTVSSSGRRLFNHLTHGFDMVVIDEAAQASEAAVLPPLSLGAARCVLIGDPQQLPATVISRAANTLQYSRSLFERFQQGGCPTMLLSVQYRMHPQIRDFPSRYFYQSRVIDSDSIASLPDEPYHSDPLLRPYVFYDVSHGRESHKGNSVSYQNVTEAQFAARLYEYLQNYLKAAGISKVSVGVITPYKLQLKCLQQEFGALLTPDVDNKSVYINTVDAFQGQERDVIIMSCVRASSHGVGFVADIRRMNVALTRARRSLWIVGNAGALVQSEDWAALISDAKQRGCFVTMSSSAIKGLNVLQNNNIGPVSASKGPGILKAPRPINHVIRSEKAD
ncbi:hypothetical protein KP509_35G070300 [Ceratopteris richardii]|uniref:Helicase ATP-binding domain-containing protein n=1 Tax=Ceratopteris richardii TaxID=49495 RepID=A0A8T2QGN3_CERRI|nr:hypothetical protein KP509_35G070300 [Ceratopteris richardii]KAH7283287.1 hypothetical protein KP509_35G070300 [Ceratopteris richardii]KAH7283288.1 hypothetical protein KP509_35G070300 [Ceratopteris richardii]KAH7283289.1 hypothetical protein KP509_35G070300 [Ceratopteris richardii]KAH7283290.1 hypothetical protein KP509_35G070300 [Ceratopteris richardii]